MAALRCRAAMLPRALLVALIAAASGGAAGNPPPPILFAADRAPLVSGEIYRLDASGRLVDLSNSPFVDAAPAVSADGRRVAFVGDRADGRGIFVVGIDGRGLERLDA